MAARLPPFRRLLLQSNQWRPTMPSSPSFPHPPPPLSPPPYGVLGRPNRLFLGTAAPDPPRYDGGLLKTTRLFLSASVLFYINGVLVDRNERLRVTSILKMTLKKWITRYEG